MSEHYLKEIIEIVRAAGEKIRDVRDVGEIGRKEGPANFVTRYDTMVQTFLMEKLSALAPEARFLAEEEGVRTKRPEEGELFVIDPIDGTTNFIYQLHSSAVSVGFYRDGRAVLGVVYNPFQEELFYAEAGQGAFLNGTRLHMTDRGLSEGIVDFGTTPYNPELRALNCDMICAVYGRAMDVRELGAAAVNLCYVACNRFVAYMSPHLCVWDYAAARLIVEEAGGVVTDWNGAPAKLRTDIPVIAATPAAHSEFLEVTEEVRRKHRV